MVELPLPIETSRLRLRSFVEGDLGALHAIQSREDVHRWLYSEPHSEAEVRDTIERRIARVREAPNMGVTLAVELAATGELLGDVSLTLGSPEHRQAEIGFTLHPGHHGRGFATEAAGAVVALAFSTYDLHRVFGRLEARNVASARVLEKLGMRREAHLVENEWVKGEWQSELVYALLAREWRGASSAGVALDAGGLRSSAPTRRSTSGALPMITKLDFVGIPSQDPERSRTFYVETLGLRPDDHSRFEVWAGDTCFGIWQPEEMGMPFAPQKNAHPALHVDDVAATRAELEGKGVEFAGETFDTGVCHMALFTDPDGNDLMLHHRYAPR